MTFEGLWKQVRGLPSEASVQVPAALSPRHEETVGKADTRGYW